MALHDPDLQYEAALDRKAREKAHLILTALKAGSQINTLAVIEHLDAYLGDTQALAELIKNTAAGQNAFGELLQKLALEIGGEQAEREMDGYAESRAAAADEQRAEIAIWHREFA
jgi:hypothetical protein